VTLKEGLMFGELGLLLKKPRAATIICKEDTEFAILEAEDYSKIL
jgi:CRP-like cAMP-binding protein